MCESIAVAFALTLASTGVNAAPVQAAEEAPSITVTGFATVSAKPDIAEVTAGVLTQAATAAQALSENSAIMTKVLKAVTGLGIADRDVQTTNISVMPNAR